MSISLYDATVGTYRQILGATANVLDKGRAHCEANDISLDDIVQMQLIDDMLPFQFQVVSVAHHSLGALKGVEAGAFSPAEPRRRGLLRAAGPRRAGARGARCVHAGAGERLRGQVPRVPDRQERHSL